ncbi:MAG: NUDIX hydrolase, partial [Megasphaera micronuciformis]
MNEQAVLAPWPEHERTSSVLFNNVPCAVLVPFIKNAGGLDLLFEVRSKTLRWQPGDISFPGGKIEASDVTPLAAAIRETGEEL